MYQSQNKHGRGANHSNQGIGSFVLSIAIGFLLLVVFLGAGIMEVQYQELAKTELAQMILGFVVIALLAAEVGAIGLGIVGVCQRGRKRLFGILGLCISSAVILLVVGLVIFGLNLDK